MIHGMHMASQPYLFPGFGHACRWGRWGRRRCSSHVPRGNSGYTSTKGSHLDFSKALEVVVVQEEGTSCTICHEDVALGHQLVLPGCDAGLLHGAHIMCMTIWLMTR